MPLPDPKPGLVISYAYLWRREHLRGQEEGAKDRPCVIVVATEQRPGGEIAVRVMPITHRLPTDDTPAMELPPRVKQHLRLDEQRSWIILDEVNDFLWPGFDLRRISGAGLEKEFDYGFLPPRFFADVLRRTESVWSSGQLRRTSIG